jgi:outer membrane protein assembly factor BamB
MRRSLIALLVLGTAARADNWPAWRGPTGQGTSAETNLPVKWSATENVKWKVPLPDAGNSTPVVWGDKVFLTQATHKGKKRSLICFARKDGSKLWERMVEYAGQESTHQTNPYCSASPATDGKVVVVSHGSAGVFCYDLDGKELWKRDLGKCDHIWGNAASPVLFQDLVILNFGPGPRTFLAALKKSDGKDAWRVEEKGSKPEEYIGSWSTPVVARVGGRTELVMSWPGTVKSYDPATGKLLWSCRGLEKDAAKDKLTYTSPLVTPEVVVALAGFGGSAIGIRTGGTGDVTDTHRLWRVTKNPQRIGSGVVVGDHVYATDEPGLRCIELKTGKTVWQERVAGGVWSSVVHADGRLYVVGQSGETVVFAPKPEFELIARNPLKEMTRASLAVSDGELFIRTYKHLWCVAEGKESRGAVSAGTTPRTPGSTPGRPGRRGS